LLNLIKATDLQFLIMSENSPTVVIPCPRCGKMGSGNYCSYCGADLHQQPEKERDPFFSFATNFLNIDNIGQYLKILITILRNPRTNTIEMYKKIPFEAAVKFMEYSVAFYTLCTASNFTFRVFSERIAHDKRWVELVSEITYLLFIVGGYLITLKLFYRFASKRYGAKNKQEYVKLYCVYAGFLIPFIGIIYFFTGIPINDHISVAGFIVNFVFGVASMVYSYYIWQYFWGGPGNKVFALLSFAGVISFASLFILRVIIFASLDIDL
jgi:hypothetical protein